MSLAAPLRSFRDTWLRRPRRFFAVVAATVLLLALADVVLRSPGISGEPAPEASWIWAREVSRPGQPVAFYAVRDFELPDLPAVAWISIAADESYALHLNGRPVGSNAYRAGMAIDRYRIERLLRPGRNRITVELRSSRGAGGLLAEARLGDGPGAVRIVTSEDWRVFRRHVPELFVPDAELGGAEKARVWHRPPTGRWRLRPAGDEQPLPYESVWQRSKRFPLRVRDLRSVTPWRKLGRGRRPPRNVPALLFEWGKLQEGLLTVELIAPGAEPALAYLGIEPPDPESRAADVVVIFVPGQKVWRDVQTRRFRYALLVGAAPLHRVSVRRLRPPSGEPRETVATEPQGVFGIRPPKLRSRAEDDVWRRVYLAPDRLEMAHR